MFAIFKVYFFNQNLLSEFNILFKQNEDLKKYKDRINDLMIKLYILLYFVGNIQIFNTRTGISNIFNKISAGFKDINYSFISSDIIKKLKNDILFKDSSIDYLNKNYNIINDKLKNCELECAFFSK